MSSSLVAVEQNATLIAVIISSQTLAASFGSACCMRRSDRSSGVQRQSDLRRQRHRDNLLLVRLCNRLIAVLYNNATITSFGYDAFGQRVYPIITTTSTDHVFVLDCFHDQELDKCTLRGSPCKAPPARKYARALFIWRARRIALKSRMSLKNLDSIPYSSKLAPRTYGTLLVWCGYLGDRQA